MKDYGKEISAFAIVVIIASLLIVIIRFVSLKIFTNRLSTFEFGTLSLILSIIGFLSVLISLGFPSSLVRYIVQYEEMDEFQNLSKMVSTTFLTIILFGSIISAVLILISSPLLNFQFFDSPRYFLIMIVISFLSILSALNLIFNGIIRAQKKGKLYLVLNLSNFYIGYVIAIVLIFISDLKVAGILLGLSLGGFISILIVFPTSVKNWGFGGFSKLELKRLLKYGAPQSVTAVVNTAYLLIFFYFIYQFVGSEELAFFYIGQSIVTPMVILETGLSMAFVPTIFRIWERNQYDILTRFVNKILKLFLIFSIGVVLIFLFLAPLFIEIISNELYAINSAVIVPFLLIEIIFRALIAINCFGASIKEKMHIIAYVHGISRIIALFILFMLLPSWGILGASIALMSGSIVYFVLAFVVSQHFVKIRYHLIPFIKIFLALIPGIIGVLVVNSQNLIFNLCISVIPFFVILLLSKTFTLKELRDILETIF
jgi:O-antigen/teichoic acid export membrane protein